MKNLSKYVATVAGLTVFAVAAFSLSPVMAGSPGQLETGSGTYVVKDVTQKGAYANTITAGACDELEYSTELVNGAYGSLSNVVVKVNLPSNSATSNTSTMTATTASGGTTGTTGSVNVNFSSAQSISYTSGTTELYNAQGTVIEKLPDTITSSGVNVGTILGSTTEFVNFEAKVNCPPVPTPCGTCNLLSLTGTEPTFTASAHYTVTNGASVNGVSFNWGDGVTTNGVTNSTGVVTSAPHTYTTPGTYKVVATVTFNSTGAAVASSSCSASVTIPKPPVTPTPPVTIPPATLVNTGPGDVIGLFAVTTVIGAVAHRLYSRRFARS
jgi:hypothetical protein